MTLVKANGNGFPTLLSDFFSNDNFFNNRWLEREFENLPAVNIKEKKNEFNIEFAAPGFNKTDFKINVDGNTLTVSAEKKTETNEEEDRFTRREFTYNSFERSFTLPQNVNGDKIDAKYNNGILRLEIPKKEEAKQLPKKEIKVA